MTAALRPGSWIGVDLDGTLATHYWHGPNGRAYDELLIGDPIPLMVERVRAWCAAGIEVRIFTARVGARGSAPGYAFNPRPIQNAIAAWTLEHVGVALEATCEKDYFMVELWDDRAVRVGMDTGERCCEGTPTFMEESH